MSDIKRVAIYIRVSHDEQVRHGLSLTAQRSSLTEYAKKHNYKIVDYYIDEGLTARKTLKKRLQFNRMIEDVKADKIDLILFIKLDRWFRNVADYYKTMEVLTAHNCTWKCTEEDYDLETSTGRLNLNIRLSMAQNEADQTADRIHYVFDNRRKEGYVTTGSTPFGYKIVDKKYVVDEENAKKLNDLFEYFNKTGSIKESLLYFKENHGNLSYSTLKRYLRNTAYIGEYRTDKGELIENYTPAIIDRDLFNHVQVLMDKNVKTPRRGSNGENFIFDGLLYCYRCGSKFGRNNKRKEYLKSGRVKVYTYYKCYRVARYVCDNRFIVNQDKLEKHLLDIIKEEADKYIAENKIKGLKQIKKPVDNTTKLKAKLRKLRDLYLEDDIDKKEYEERKNKIEKELEENIKELNTIEKPKDLRKLEKLINSDFITLYHTLNDKNKRRFWASFINKIYIDNGTIVSIDFL